MNYINLKECVDYLILRIKMNLNHTLQNYDTLLTTNEKKTKYKIIIIIYILSKKYKFKITISNCLKKKEIEKLILNLLNQIESKCLI